MKREPRVPSPVDEVFEAMNEIPTPDPARQTAARSAFLADARRLRAIPAPQARRPWGWVTSLLSPKEVLIMTPIAKALAVVLVLSITATGTAAAADGSLPGDALYTVDMLAEQVQLILATNDQVRAQLYLKLATERADEVLALAAKGTPPDSATLDRLQTRLQDCLAISAQLQPQEMNRLLTQLHEMAQLREGAMQGAGLGAAAGLMARARQQAQFGIEDPAGFQQRHRHGASWADDGPNENPGDETLPGSGAAPDEGDTDLPSTQGDGVPDRDRDQQRLQDGSCLTDGTCDQTRDQDRDQLHLQDGSCQDGTTECVPQGDQHQYGPSGNPGGSPGGGKNG